MSANSLHVYLPIKMKSKANKESNTPAQIITVNNHCA